MRLGQGPDKDERDAATLAGALEVFADTMLGHENAIERQEARGQQRFVNNETTLPRDLNGCTAADLERMGIKLGNDVNDIFRRAELPAGWRKVPTEHSMWSDIVDERGRKRAAVFYKAAFYDRDAHMTIVRRYAPNAEPEHGWEAARGTVGARFVAIVHDADGTVLYRSEPFADIGSRDNWATYKPASDQARFAAMTWLNEHYPQWQDLHAYWNDEPQAGAS